MFLIYFLLHCTACTLLVPQPGMDPGPNSSENTRFQPLYHQEIFYFLFLSKLYFIKVIYINIYLGFPGSTSGKEANSQCRRNKRHWVGNILWTRKWPPTPEFLPGESYGQRRLACYSPWGHKELNRAKENSERDGNTRPPDLLPEKSGSRSRSNS